MIRGNLFLINIIAKLGLVIVTHFVNLYLLDI